MFCVFHVGQQPTPTSASPREHEGVVFSPNTKSQILDKKRKAEAILESKRSLAIEGKISPHAG
jgi:hypothetical protein